MDEITHKYGLFLWGMEVTGHCCTTYDEIKACADSMGGKIKIIPVTELDKQICFANMAVVPPETMKAILAAKQAQQPVGTAPAITGNGALATHTPKAKIDVGTGPKTYVVELETGQVIHAHVTHRTFVWGLIKPHIANGIYFKFTRVGGSAVSYGRKKESLDKLNRYLSLGAWKSSQIKHKGKQVMT